MSHRRIVYVALSSPEVVRELVAAAREGIRHVYVDRERLEAELKALEGAADRTEADLDRPAPPACPQDVDPPRPIRKSPMRGETRP